MRGVEKCSRFGRGPVVDGGVANSGCVAACTPAAGVGGVGLKKVWIGVDPLVPAPRHSLRKLVELMIRRLLSRCSCMPQRVQLILVQASSLDVVIEGLFVDSFVDAGTTFCAFEIPLGLLKVVLVGVWCLVDLSLEDIADDLYSGELLGWLRGLLTWCGTCLVRLLLGACFCQSFFKLLCCEALMHARATCGARIPTSLWSPSVMRLLPGLGAKLDEILFSLFGVLAWLSVCLVVQVVLFVLVNLLESLSCLEVYGFVVLVQCSLPGCLSSVVESISPFPGSQCRISLAPSELRLIAWGVRGPGVVAGVEDGYAVAVLVRDLCQEIRVRVPVGRFLPGFPDRAELHNHFWLGWLCVLPMPRGLQRVLVLWIVARWQPL